MIYDFYINRADAFSFHHFADFSSVCLPTYECTVNMYIQCEFSLALYSSPYTSCKCNVKTGID